MATHSSNLRNTWATAVATALDSGPGNAKIRIYTAGKATLLGEVTCAAGVGTVLNGVLTFGTFTDDPAADASGTAAVYEACRSDNTVEFEGIVGQGSGELNMTSTEVVAGQPIQITSGTWTAPA